MPLRPWTIDSWSVEALLRWAVSAFALSGELRKRDTVAMLSPARKATSWIVDAPFLSCYRF